jgi:vanillate O-demethylase ferredoxin subunit
LPKPTAGSHIDIHLPNGLIRKYSLCSELHANDYEIAVLNEPQGRGGFAYIHANLCVGDTLSISEPKNLFALESKAKKTLLFAAGIGITPILAMATYLLKQGSDFHLHYCGKSPKKAAYIDRIKTQGLRNLPIFTLAKAVELN